MKYGSVCSGIEAASVAWESLGWQAQWYSEIEHFPSAVLAHRFPTVPNLGDMTQIHNSEHFNGNSIDLLVGGTPCQSFSVAGLRKGLDDTRGQLMLTFCELAARKRPKWIVWENVPGVLSSNKGEDLASFLGLLTGREIHPPVGGWKNSGVVEGIGSAYGVAWTVLDAQYFGVAQRRRRIFAIGYLGDWRPAAAVLFEYHRLSGDIKEGRKKRKATSADAQGGVGGGGIPRVSGSLDTECGGGKLTHQSVNNGHLVPAWWNGEQTAATLTKMNANGAQRMPDKDNFGAVLEPKPIGINGDVAGTLDANYYKGCGSANYGEREVVTHAFKVRGGSEVETGEQGGTPGKKAGKGYLGSDELAFTIGTTQDQQIAHYPIAYSFDSLASNSMKSSNPNSGCREVETSSTIDATTPTPSKNQGGIAIAQPVPFRKAKRAQSKDDHETWEQDEKTNTLNAFDTGDIRTTQAVVHHSKAAGFIPKNGAKARSIGYTEEQTPTLDTGCSTLGVVHSPIAVDCYNQTINEKTSQTIGSSASDVNHYGAVLTPTIIDRAAFNQGQNAQYDIKIEEGQTMPSLVAKGPHGVATQNLAPALTASNNPSRSPQSSEVTQQIAAVHRATMAIRRLTPRECERLQGFPDDWTLIPYRNKSVEQCPDGPRYKACGNSMAVPVMRWIGERIQMVEDIINNKAV
jgi:site-specific DNA-cytosine methylase